jgi:hypothetical protein
LRALVLAFLCPLTAANPGTPESPPQQVDNVSAFARIYGVARYFYPSDAAASLDWDRFAVYGVALVRAAPDRSGLGAALRALFSPLGPGIEIGPTLSPPISLAGASEPLVAWRYLGPALEGNSRGGYSAKRTYRASLAPEAELFEGDEPTPGAHVDLDLGSGLMTRVVLVLTDSQARLNGSVQETSLDALKAALATVPSPGATPHLDTRLADVVVAWNVFRHFYPYWAEAAVDWDARLRAQLQTAWSAETRGAHQDALRALVADARDGHAGVRDTLVHEERASLPVRFRVLEGSIVITASAVPEAPVGAVVSQFDGLPMAQKLEKAMRLSSGTTQWQQVCAEFELAAGRRNTSVALTVDTATGRRELRLRYDVSEPPSERRPEPLTELEPGVWYVDLTRTNMAQVTPKLKILARARGIVFDVRGNASDAGIEILGHLIDAPEADRWMHVAKLVGPFGQSAGWESYGWNLKPVSPRLTGRIAFLTDGRAISYTESVMGYVADLKLGTILGSTTAGTNGGIEFFDVPGGFRLSLSGMRVTRHDGRRPHHLVGIKPDIAVTPTIAGVRAGHDEVLERAMTFMHEEPTKAGGS